MSTQYSGGPYVNTTFTCSTGTRREIVDGIVGAISVLGAPWSIISGGGTGSVILESGTPLTGQPAGCKMRVNILDPGSGNCAKIKLRNAAGSFIQSDAFYLLPAAGKTFRVCASPYWVIVMTTSLTNSREFVYWHVPYIPSNMQSFVTEAFHGHGNAVSDTDTTPKASLRTAFNASGVGPTGQPGTANQVNALNGNYWEVSASGSGSVFSGAFNLFIGGHGAALGAGSTPSGYRWGNGEALEIDCICGWGLTALTDECKWWGQGFDMTLSTDSYTQDDTDTFSGHDWRVLGTQAGSASSTRGSVLVAVS